MSSPAPGWYPDPSDAANLRYWDGSAWTSHVASPQAPPVSPAPPPVTPVAPPAPQAPPAPPTPPPVPAAPAPAPQAPPMATPPPAPVSTPAPPTPPAAQAPRPGASAATSGGPSTRTNLVVLAIVLVLGAGIAAAAVFGWFDGDEVAPLENVPEIPPLPGLDRGGDAPSSGGSSGVPGLRGGSDGASDDLMQQQLEEWEQLQRELEEQADQLNRQLEDLLDDPLG